MLSLTRLFYDVDDFCKTLLPDWEKAQIENGEKTRRKKRCIFPSEIITWIVYYHQSGYDIFKWFYLRYLPKNLSKAFPKVPRYNRFIELLPDIIGPFTAFMQTR